MKKILVLGFVAFGAMLSTQAMAQGPRTNLNLEPTCQGVGGGMDPRCIGDVTPGSDRALRRTRTGQRFDSRASRSRGAVRQKASKRTAINCNLRANMNNPRCR